MTKIERKEYRKLVWCGRALRAWCESAMIYFIFDISEPRGFLQIVTFLTVVASVIHVLVGLLVKKINIEYEVIDTAPVREYEYIEHDQPMKRSVPVRPMVSSESFL